MIKTGKWEMSLVEEEGFQQFRPTTYLEATTEEVDSKTGGCGPGKFGDWLVPDSALGESLFLACRCHDWMYGEVESKEDKFWADLWFDFNMTLLVNDGETLDPARLKITRAYYIAVSFLGGKYTNVKKEEKDEV